MAKKSSLLNFKKGGVASFSISDLFKKLLGGGSNTEPGAVDDDAKERIRKRKKRLKEAAEN